MSLISVFITTTSFSSWSNLHSTSKEFGLASNRISSCLEASLKTPLQLMLYYWWADSRILYALTSIVQTLKVIVVSNDSAFIPSYSQKWYLFLYSIVKSFFQCRGIEISHRNQWLARKCSRQMSFAHFSQILNLQSLSGSCDNFSGSGTTTLLIRYISTRKQPELKSQQNFK